MELIIVMIVIGIVVSFALPGFQKAQRRAIDKEARTTLKLMRSAHKNRVLFEGAGEECDGKTDCDTTLGLDLRPDPPVGNWLYRVILSGIGHYSFRAIGNEGTPATGWELNESEDTASSF